MKKLLTLVAILTVVFTGCPTNDGNGNDGGGNGATKTTLTIKNTSDYDFNDTLYASIDFARIESNKEVTKTVSAGTSSISFSIDHPIIVVCRTDPLTCEEGANRVATITNSTIVTVTVRNLKDSIENIVRILDEEYKGHPKF